MEYKNKLFFNTLGTLLDKAMPLFVSVLLVKYIPISDYAKWSIYYSYIIVVHTFAFSPLFIKYSKNYNNDSKIENKFQIHSASLVLFFFFVSTTFFFIYFGFDWKFFILELCGFFLFPMYEYVAYINRFTGNDFEYLRSSLIKFIIFIIGLIVSFLLFNKLEYFAILISFIFSYSFIFVNKIRHFVVFFNISDTSEFLLISFYGILSTFTSSIDKYIMTFQKYSVEDIASFSYIVTLIALPSVFIETLKKSFNPIIFKSFHERDNKNKDAILKTNAKFYIVIAVILQLVIPFVSFLVLKFIGLVNFSLIKPGFIETFILLNISTSIFVSYHFINQFFFYYSFTKSLIFYQLVAFVFSVLFLKYLGNFNALINIGMVKSIQLLVVVVMSYLGLRYYDK